MRESGFNGFQKQLIDELESMFEGCVVLKNDSSYLQGVPDLVVFYKDKWAMFECKASAKSTRQPNQEWYVKMFDEMSFAAFIYPENKEEVLGELQSAFGTGR